MSPKDYYAALGIDRRESFPGIHKAYRQLAKACHPDRVGEEGTQRFQELQEAYEVLSDPGKRKTYDANIDRRRRLSTVTVGACTVEPLVPSTNRWRSEPLLGPSADAIQDVRRRTEWTFCDRRQQEEAIDDFITRCLSALRFRGM